METLLRFCGYVGAVLVCFGVLGGVVVGSFTEQPLLVVHLIVGVICLLLWGVTSGFAGLSKAKQVVSGRTARFGANALLYTIVAAGLVVLVNVYVSLHDKRWDLTEQGVYSLSEKSRKVVGALQKPLKLVAIDAPQVQDKTQTRELLDLYKYANDTKVDFEILDPRSRPVEVDRLGMKPGNLLYLEYGEGDSKVINRLNQIDEQSITNAVLKLTRGAARKLYYVQGHGEPSLESQGQGGMKDFADALGDEHITIEGLLLAQTGKVPDDAAAVIVAAPTKPIPQAERDAIIQYANGGGRLLLFANAEDVDSDDVRTIAKAFSIDVGQDVVLDEQLRLFAGPQMAVQFIAQTFSPHPITAGLTKAEPIVFTFASSISAPKEPPSGYQFTELLRSGKNSWAEKNLSMLFSQEEATASKDPEDLKGPVSIAVAMERDSGAKDTATQDEKFKNVTRVVVFGDATWIENGNLAAMGNRDLVLNAVNWATGEEGGVAIGPKNIRASVAPIPAATFNIILALSFLGPEVILLLGLFIWWRRRMILA
jgi:ABC-type uncharacterized transport system involved in gliding motility auxiliary subunit